jgi:hypothetical protein
MPKKRQKLGIFGLKQSATVLGGHFSNIVIDVPCGFLMVFLAKQHQAKLILQGFLFGTFVVVFVGHFLK